MHESPLQPLIKHRFFWDLPKNVVANPNKISSAATYLQDAILQALGS